MPSKLLIEDLDASLICQFLNHLEEERHNTPRTRNHRLAAIRSFFNYASFREPQLSAHIQRVLAIPTKRYQKREIDFLTVDEVDAILDAIDGDSWIGRRDHALISLAIHTGMRVSEIINLFSGTPDGAKASANLYSLIETAKANKLEPYKYLRYLFEKIPFAENEVEYKALLPMNLNTEQLVLPDRPTGV
jgi:site-specific recombinase XerD